jgi:hypothetical protein
MANQSLLLFIIVAVVRLHVVDVTALGDAPFESEATLNSNAEAQMRRTTDPVSREGGEVKGIFNDGIDGGSHSESCHVSSDLNANDSCMERAKEPAEEVADQIRHTDPAAAPASDGLIFHLVQTTQAADVGPREIVALESVLHHHPDATVLIHASGDAARPADLLALQDLAAPYRARGFRVEVRARAPPPPPHPRNPPPASRGPSESPPPPRPPRGRGGS